MTCNHMSNRQKPQLKNAIFGSKLSFLGFTISFYSKSWLHHLHPLANCVRKAFLHLHFSVWSMFDCPALSFAAPQLYGMVPVNATANHSCTILSQTQKQVWIQLLEEAWMSSHSDMLHAFHSLPSVWVANHHHGPMLLPWLSSSRRKIAKPDLQVQVCRCARDEPGLTKAMERRKRICIAAEKIAISKW